MIRMPSEASRVWTEPTLIAVATLVALVGALVVEDFWDPFAALLLFATLAYPVRLGLRRRDRRG